MRKLRKNSGVGLIYGLMVFGGITALSVVVVTATSTSGKHTTRTAVKGESFYLAESGLNSLVGSVRPSLIASGTLPTGIPATTLSLTSGRTQGTYRATISNSSVTTSTAVIQPGTSHRITRTTKTYRFRVTGIGEAAAGPNSEVRRDCEVEVTQDQHRTEQWVNVAHFCAPPTWQLQVTTWNDPKVVGQLTSNWALVK